MLFLPARTPAALRHTDRVVRLLLGVLLGLFALTPALHAQSTRIQQPTPLGPGSNTGIADSTVGTQYVSFHAGPGAFRVKLSFKSMGVFGNPLREALSFDFYDVQGKMISHNAVVSQDKLESAETGGEYPDARLLVLAVIPPAGVIRTGGRYAIEATGAVSFDAAAPLHATGTPFGEQSLVKPSGPLVQPGGPLVKPGGAPVQAAAPAAASGGALVQPSGPLVKPAGPLVQSSGPLVHAGGPLLHPVVVSETRQEIRVALAGDVLFDFDQASLRPDAMAALRQAAALIRSRSHGGVRIEGHTDAKGSSDYNLRLSDQRARAVAGWLVQQGGFAPARFQIQAFGATHPVAPNVHPDGSDDPIGRQRNRRVELVIAK